MWPSCIRVCTFTHTSMSETLMRCMVMCVTCVTMFWAHYVGLRAKECVSQIRVKTKMKHLLLQLFDEYGCVEFILMWLFVSYEIPGTKQLCFSYHLPNVIPFLTENGWRPFGHNAAQMTSLTLDSRDKSSANQRPLTLHSCRERAVQGQHTSNRPSLPFARPPPSCSLIRMST